MVSAQAKKVYQRMLRYILNKQQELRAAGKVNLQDLLPLAEQVVQQMELSEDLNIYAVNYYDINDITISHSANVAIFATTLKKGIGADHEELRAICAAGIVHDIGGAQIPKEIVQKDEDSLSTEEILYFRKHSFLGYKAILDSHPQYETIAELVYQHHERCDGSGFPQGLKKNEMAPDACIISMIDVYESLIHPRGHRDALVPPEGVSEILNQEAQRFDRKLLKALIEHISIYPVGCYVELNTGEVARIMRTTAKNPLRPEVKVLYNRAGERIDPVTYRLTEHPLTSITKPVPPPGWQAQKQR